MTGWMIRNKTTGLFFNTAGNTWQEIGKLYPKIGFAKKAVSYHNGRRWQASNVEIVEVEILVLIKADNESL